MSAASDGAGSALPGRVVIATRESALAMWQARHVKSLLSRLYPRVEIVIVGMTTEGDRRLGTSLARIGGKGLFVKELEDRITHGTADLAVHSVKDVPMQLPEGFTLAAVTERADPRDAFVSGRFAHPDALPPGGRVGTSSLRRESQLRSRYPQLRILPLRGNVQTRLGKLDSGEYDAIILAAAGLRRLGLEQRITYSLEVADSIPAVGQGALGIECLAARGDLLRLLLPLNHGSTAVCVSAERALSRALAGSCNVPLGAHATLEDGWLRLRAFVGAPDGSRQVSGEITGSPDEAEHLGGELAERLKADGAAAILARLQDQVTD